MKLEPVIRDNEFDAYLSALAARNHGRCLAQNEIADFCGVDPRRIAGIEQAALQALSEAVLEALIETAVYARMNGDNYLWQNLQGSLGKLGNGRVW